MSHKHLLFRSDAREKVLRGATAIADAVRVTLGPKSRCVLIETTWGKPIVCNDGVTIAKEFALKDADENLGAQMLRGAAERTADAVGDGTTTATLLAHAILAEGVRNIAAGASAIDLKRGLDRGARAAVDVEAAHLDGDERAGVLILRRALEAPARQIAANSGVDGGVVVEKMRAGSGAFGFDGAAGQYADLTQAGIIDPTKVVRLALENAVSVADVLLLTEATMTAVPEEKLETVRAAAEAL